MQTLRHILQEPREKFCLPHQTPLLLGFLTSLRLELTQSLVEEAAEDGPSLLPPGGPEAPLTLTLVQFQAPPGLLL